MLINNLEAWQLALGLGIAILLMSQAVWVFNDAPKRHMNRWIWGLFCLLNTPTNIIIYLIVSRRFNKLHACHHCQKTFLEKYTYCPYCGTKKM